ncbi:unnamed protein product [Effrenium voratum]|uniref:Uncharacterized protein n=1 Tax=Effrenium voratum TaxID=2562239 RepID=A0AA36JR23_9DINO|nr:unnamed protein product [Effrenium voratum]
MEEVDSLPSTQAVTNEELQRDLAVLQRDIAQVAHHLRTVQEQLHELTQVHRDGLGGVQSSLLKFWFPAWRFQKLLGVPLLIFLLVLALLCFAPTPLHFLPLQCIQVSAGSVAPAPNNNWEL